MRRFPDVRLKLAWILGVLALVAAGVVVHRIQNPEPTGKVAVDFLAAIERRDFAAAESLVQREPGDPDPRHLTQPSVAWHPVGVVDVTEDRVTVEVAPVVDAPTRIVLLITEVGGKELVSFPWDRAVVDVADGPMDVRFAGSTYTEATGFSEFVLPGIYEVTGVRPDTGASATARLVVPAPDGTIPSLTLPAA